MDASQSLLMCLDGFPWMVTWREDVDMSDSQGGSIFDDLPVHVLFVHHKYIYMCV